MREGKDEVTERVVRGEKKVTEGIWRKKLWGKKLTERRRKARKKWLNKRDGIPGKESKKVKDIREKK